MDPLSKTSIYHITNSPNSIVDAFEAAASSFAVNHHLPGATFYSLQPNPPTEQSAPPNTTPQNIINNIESKLRDENPEKLHDVRMPQNSNTQAPNIEKSPLSEPKMPIPSNSIIYPPPMLDDSDPDKMRLLHSWYWAGYYTGLADGKKSVENH